MDNTHLPRPSWMWYLGFVNFKMPPSLAEDHLIPSHSSHLFLAFAYFPSTLLRGGGALNPIFKNPAAQAKSLTCRRGFTGLSVWPTAPQVFLEQRADASLAAGLGQPPWEALLPCWLARGRAGREPQYLCFNVGTRGPDNMEVYPALEAYSLFPRSPACSQPGCLLQSAASFGRRRLALCYLIS